MTHERTNVVIIHGCISDEERALDQHQRTYDKHWMPWIEQRLKTEGIQVHRPLMPEPWKPDYEAYARVLNRHRIDEKTTLIGHSCGTAFLVRYLADTKKRIDTLILVAPWKIPSSTHIGADAFYTYRIDPTIKDRVRRIIYFTSDTEEERGKASLALFHEALGGTIIMLEGRGHYVLEDMGTEAFPELLETVLERINRS